MCKYSIIINRTVCRYISSSRENNFIFIIKDFAYLTLSVKRVRGLPIVVAYHEHVFEVP